MIFGKSKSREEVKLSDDFSCTAVSASFDTDWVFFALSRFDNEISSSSERKLSSVATGIVHFNIGLDHVIPARLTLTNEKRIGSQKIGIIRYNSLRNPGIVPPHIVLEVILSDHDCSIRRSLADAFRNASLSKLRFVYVSIKRNKLALDDELLKKLNSDKFGAQSDVSEITIEQRLSLPEAPRWSWNWNEGNY